MRRYSKTAASVLVVLLALAACQEKAPETPTAKGVPSTREAPPVPPVAPPSDPPEIAAPDTAIESHETIGKPVEDAPADPVVKPEEQDPSDDETAADAPASVEKEEGAPAMAASKSESLREERAKALVSNRTIVGTLGSDWGGAGFAGGGGGLGIGGPGASGLVSLGHGPQGQPVPREVPGTEDYAKTDENEFKEAIADPLSTFSIDVDTASYTNMRRFIDKMHRLPPADAVRIEEFINYFTYDYPTPTGETPFSVTTEISDCPWMRDHRMVLIGIQGKKPPRENLPPSNLVFLVDSSGSMQSDDKLPLLKKGFEMLTQQLGEKDRVAIVVYAGSAGLVLPSTPGTDKETILAALDRLRAGGSTAGAAGIQLAYQVAQDNFIKGGNNRVILATDGDFNVGASSNAEMERLIEGKRDAGVFLTVLGFGMGNTKDSRMETLADKGNGNYGYIDNILEAKKVFVTQMTGTLFTIAKDVKIQVEFNPTKVKSYRLIGYENRMLNKEDFANDKKDAGELGAGHTVTALYEIVPAQDGAKTAEELRYVKTAVKTGDATASELLTVKLRYKMPDGDTSTLLESPLLDQGIPLAKASTNFRFAAAVAQFAMLLKKSSLAGNTTYDNVLELARSARGEDPFGYRAEFIQLVEKAQLHAPARD